MNKPIGQLRLQTIIPMILQRLVWRHIILLYFETSVQYEQAYEQAPPYIHDPGPSAAGPSSAPVDSVSGEKPRGRKRSRNQASSVCVRS